MHQNRHLSRKPSQSSSNPSSREARQEARRIQQQNSSPPKQHRSRKERREAKKKQDQVIKERKKKEFQEYMKQQDRIFAEMKNQPRQGPPLHDEYDGYDWPDRDQQEVQWQWEEGVYPDNNEAFYFNEIADKAQWDPPPGFNRQHQQHDHDEIFYDDCSSVSSEATAYLSDASDDVHNQWQEPYCYAFAFSTVARTNERSAGRRPHSFNKTMSGVIDRWACICPLTGLDPSERLQLLSYEGGKRNLVARRITLAESLLALEDGLAVYAVFSLSGPQWKRMDGKLKVDPRTVVRAEDLGPREKQDQEEMSAYEECSGAAHCVAIVGWNKRKGYFYIKNSYGERYADGGYFRLHKNATKLFLYELIHKSQMYDGRLSSCRCRRCL